MTSRNLYVGRIRLYLWILWKIRYFRDNMKKLRSLTFPVLLLFSCLIGCGIWGFTNPEKFQSILDIARNYLPEQKKKADKPLPVDLASVSTQPKQVSEGNALLRKSRLMMQEQITSFRAEILQILQTPETSYRATGTYTQTADLKSRLELQMEVQGIQGSFLQVSDGQVVWLVREIKNLQQIRPVSSEVTFMGRELQIERVDLKRLFDYAEAEKISFRDSRFAREFAAGIPGLLASLEDEMNFTLLKQVALQGVPHFLLQGKWKVPPDERGFEDHFSTQLFAGETPDKVRLYLRASDLMLSRYLCMKKRPSGNGWYAPLAMELKNIEIEGDFSQTNFHYQPASDQVSKDVTHKYLQRLQKSFEVIGIRH